MEHMETNGAVKPATVELKALMVGGEQMTLPVFRQLQNEDLIDYYSGQLKGVPWGRVNYPPGDCVEDDKHIHVVWQKGGELRRACVRHKPRIPCSLKRERNWAECLYLAQAVLHRGITELTRNQHLLLLSNEILEPLIFSCLSYQESLRDCLRNKQEGHPRFSSEKLDKYAKGYKENVEESREKLREYVAAYPYEQGFIEHAQRLIAEFKHAWQQSYAAVEATEQLFIAV